MARRTPATIVRRWPSRPDSQADSGLVPRERNTTRELARQASVLEAWKVSLMAGRMRPKESLKPLWRTWIMKVAKTMVQARHPSRGLVGNMRGEAGSC